MDRDTTPTVLLVTNRRLDENAGRAEKFATRRKLLREYGWNLEVGYVKQTTAGLPIGTARCVRKARTATVVNSVSNPPELQVAGAIAAKVTGTPWLVEFRDPLVTNPDVDTGSLGGRVRKGIERYALEHADKVVWYDGIQLPRDYFAREYPDVPADRYEQLPPIGYETAKFDSIEPTDFGEFTITYAGSFYDGWIEPLAFLEGFGQYLESHTDTEIQARFYGDWDSSYDRATERTGTADNVSVHPFVPHEEIVSIMKGSDALLYIGGTDTRNQRNLPSKLYDYIGAKTPILALVDPSFRVAEVIDEYDLGIVVDPEDTGAVRDAIATLRTGAYDYRSIDGETFTREASTRAYVDALESIR